jgi:1-acyl-sn-glycerol-3-phosphate acyltransferase
MLSRIRTILHYIIGFGSISFVIILMYIFPKKQRTIRKKWAIFQTKALGANLIVSGEIDEDAKLFLINHKSMLDIIAIESLMPNDPCWVAKKEITDLPWFGRVNDVPRMISIDREDKRGLITLLKEVKDRLDNKRVVMIFPEGTRSKGDKLLKFKAGAKIIAEKYNLKIQPVVVKGTNLVLDTKEHRINKGDVCISFLKSFTPDKNNKDWFNTLRDDMQKEYDKQQVNGDFVE